jgi:ribosomal protein L10
MNVTQYEMHLRDLEMTEKIKDAFVTLKVSRNATLLECYDASRRLGRACLADESAGKAATAESIHKIMTAYKTIEDFLTKIRARATADIKRPN